MELTIKQTKALDLLEDQKTNDVIFGGGAGGAKSFLGCYWLIKNCIKYPGTRWVMGRAKLKTLKETTLISFFKVAKMQNVWANIHYKFNQQSGVIEFWNGSQILLKDLFLYPSDPEFDELGSLEITGAFVDEVNQVTLKAITILKSRIRHGLDENELIPKFLGTCNPSKNWVYQDYYLPDKKGEMAENKAFVQALVTDNPFISKHYKQNLERLDENSKQRLLFGNWEYDDDPTVLIPYENILNCFSNTFVEPGPKYITADIARFGRDKTVIGVWSGFRLFKVISIDKSGLDEVKEELEKIRVEHKIPLSNIIVDEDGVGGGVVDFLKCKGFVNNSKPIEIGSKKENFRNLKSQCYFGISDRINSNQLYFGSMSTEAKAAITEELQYVKQKNMDKDGRKEVLSKDEIKDQLGRSPDYADMIMMRFWFELKPKYFLVGS
jgi:phage terminase large subunit